MIAIDLRGTQSIGSGAHGGGEYVRSLLGRIRERNLQDRFLGIVVEDRPTNDYVEYARTCGLPLLPVRSNNGLAAALRSRNVALFYSPLPYGMRKRPDGIRTVVTIHGLRSLELPTDSLEWRYIPFKRFPILVAKSLSPMRYRRWRQHQFREIVDFADTIVVPSEHTKFALLALFKGLSEDRICVYYSPTTIVSTLKSTDDRVLGEYGLGTKAYVLLVSGGRFEKNIIRGLDAIGLLQENGSWPAGLKIVVTGGRPLWLKAKHRRMASFLPYLSTEKLAAFYRHARLFIYPTLNEGFGYPPLESLSHGTPVVASGLCSLPEINGNAIGYFDPHNIYDIAARILQFLHSNSGTIGAEAQRKVQGVRVRQLADLDRLIDFLCA